MADVPTIVAAQSIGVGNLIAGRYEIRCRLGAGGMGAVYRVLDTEIEEDVALKILSAVSDNGLARFRREVKLARRVTHANVARTYDLGTHQDIRFLTMELIEGASLAERHDGRPVALGEALRIAAEVARGLVAAHAVGVVHRDLKPQNIMLAQDRVVITDFGIARLTETSGADAQLTTGNVIGTPAYMAPEQVEGGGIDGRADVFALGVLLYEMLAGCLPFGGDSAIAMAMSRLTKSAPDLRELSDIPEVVARLVADALARRAEDRPDAVALLARIEAARGGAAQKSWLGSARAETESFAPGPKTVIVRPFQGEANAAELARDLACAVADALAQLEGVRVVPPTFMGSEAETAIEGSVRVASSAVRVRLRLVDPGRSTQLFGRSIDGTWADPFEIEDRVTAAAIEAVRTHVARADRRGPTDAKLREIFDRARAAHDRFALPYVRDSIRLCEEILAKEPGEPHTMAQLAASLVRAWAQLGATDAAMAARAEELALRAGMADPSLPDAHYAVAALRIMSGELRAGLAAAEETLRRMPLHGGAHYQIGRLLCESGRVEEGMRRLELASRIQPADATPAFERARTHALIGRRDLADAILEDVRARSGPLSTIVVDTRFAVWFHDVALASRTAEEIRGKSTGAAWEAAVPLMESLVARAPCPDATELFGRLTTQLAAPRHRALMFATAAEFFARAGQLAEAMDALEQSARLPTTDLLWLDRCPALDPLRHDPRLAAARAIVAARVAELWS